MYWGDGDEGKALGLTRLFFWMIFSYYQYHLKVDQKGSSLESLTTREAAHKLLANFGDVNEGEIQLYVSLDTQFKYDISRSPHMIHLSCLLLALSSEICGHQCLDWTKIRFPVIEMFHIAHKGAIVDSEPIRDQRDISEMQSALLAGIKAANLYYEKA